MILELTGSGVTFINKNTYYFVLSEYPEIQAWEWNNIIAFIVYEKSIGQATDIVCENGYISRRVTDAADKLNGTEYIPPIDDMTEEFIYHATDVEAAKSILSGGKLLSATRVYNKTGAEISADRQKTGWVDSPDFYEYIMFGWGSHSVGDYVVLSLNFPDDEAFRAGNFDAGIRFYFKYTDIIKHRGHVFDGYHSVKVKEEILLSDYLYACIVPEQFKPRLENSIEEQLKDKIHYLPQRGLTPEKWNENVIRYVQSL